jgi:hypothetical protein
MAYVSPSRFVASRWLQRSTAYELERLGMGCNAIAHTGYECGEFLHLSNLVIPPTVGRYDPSWLRYLEDEWRRLASERLTGAEQFCPYHRTVQKYRRYIPPLVCSQNILDEREKKRRYYRTMVAQKFHMCCSNCNRKWDEPWEKRSPHAFPGAAFQIDHDVSRWQNPSGKQFNFCSFFMYNAGESAPFFMPCAQAAPLMKEELNKCSRYLCHNCHQKHTAVQRGGHIGGAFVYAEATAYMRDVLADKVPRTIAGRTVRTVRTVRTLDISI